MHGNLNSQKECNLKNIQGLEAIAPYATNGNCEYTDWNLKNEIPTIPANNKIG